MWKIWRQSGAVSSITDPIAVSVEDLNAFGCPHCGYRSGYTPMSGGGAYVWHCGSKECGKTSLALAEGIRVSPISVGDLYPKIRRHPRHGIPSHGTRDKQPTGGGEYFHSRGIGLEFRLVCFCCGFDPEGTCLDNIAAFVQCKASGERIVNMFNSRARLDYREHSPDRVQVKIGACKQHLPNLEKMHSLVGDGRITKDRIAQAIS